MKSVASSTTSPEVFISYQWGSREVALELKKRLEERGIHCWMDISQMGGGDALFAKIDAGIRASKVKPGGKSTGGGRREGGKRYSQGGGNWEK